MRQRSKRAVVLTVGVVYALTASTVVISSLPVHAHLSAEGLKVANAARTLFPQGWAFFTKDATETRLAAFVRNGSGWTEVSRVRNAQLEYGFGLDRSSRLEDMNVSRFHEPLGDDLEWSACEEGESVIVCANGIDVTNVESAAPGVCGEVIVVRRDPVPFAYAGRVREMPAFVMKVDYKCD